MHAQGVWVGYLGARSRELTKGEGREGTRGAYSRAHLGGAVHSCPLSIPRGAEPHPKQHSTHCTSAHTAPQPTPASVALASAHSLLLGLLSTQQQPPGCCSAALTFSCGSSSHYCCRAPGREEASTWWILPQPTGLWLQPQLLAGSWLPSTHLAACTAEKGS